MTEIAHPERGSKRADTAQDGDALSARKEAIRPSEDLKAEAWIVRLRRNIVGFLVGTRVSTLTRRIIACNVVAIFVFVGGMLYLNQFRAGLIDLRIQSLMTEGEMIAGAIAEWATIEPDVEIIDPFTGSLTNLDTDLGQTCGQRTNIDLGTARPVLERLALPTGSRARLYDTRACLVLDTRNLSGGGDVVQFHLPPPGDTTDTWFGRVVAWVEGLVPDEPLPLYREVPDFGGAEYDEVNRALSGERASAVRGNEQGQLILSIAIPLQPLKAVRGALLLSTEGGDIDAVVRDERIAILQVFVVALATSIIVAVLLAATIAIPVRRLAEAAERVRRGVGVEVEIPDFTRRKDEIGELSGVLRDMTRALYNRIGAIEQFAADVSHELKNPLSSLRSAVETLPLARDEEGRAKLMDIIQDDVVRLDRLITDISDASRLDAELGREEAAPLDLEDLLKTTVGLFNSTRREEDAPVVLEIVPALGLDDQSYRVIGFEGRIAQVIGNLVDNARSFSPAEGTVRISLRREPEHVVVRVDDDGPGIPEENLKSIFDRFYTQRPDPDAFGKNSGLGLSISKQIVEAHHGRIWAENRRGSMNSDDAGAQILGARFVIRLPAAPKDG